MFELNKEPIQLDVDFKMEATMDEPNLYQYMSMKPT